MFTLGHMILAVVLTWILTAFTYLFAAGSSIRSREEEAYKCGYEKGYNKGYNVGKAGRLSDTATVNDVIQELVDNGTPRDQAIKFASQYLGGW